MPDVTESVALSRIRALLTRPAKVVDGYLDVMGSDTVPQSTAQRVMGSTLLPKIYGRLWRPVAFFGFTMRNTVDEDRTKLRLLDLKPGDTVLDVACGPGNTTRTMLAAVGPNGLVIGVDSAATMLGQAVIETEEGMSAATGESGSADTPVGFVRADGADLPFGADTFDAVSCYGALYLMDDPFATLHEMVRVLKPGGRIAVLTTCARGPSGLRRLSVAASQMAPLRLFDVHEITMAFRASGLIDVQRKVTAASQTVSARRPE